MGMGIENPVADDPFYNPGQEYLQVVNQRLTITTIIRVTLNIKGRQRFLKLWDK
jgi:hypothetical protein